MKVLNQKNENLWEAVEVSLNDHTSAGYKISCIEAEKVFKYLLKSKGYPTKEMDQFLTLFGWKLTNKEGIKKALKKTEEIKESFDYKLSNFEAEEIVEAFRQAINDFSGAKALGWQKRFVLFYQNYISIKSSFAKKLVFGIFGFFLVVKLLARTTIGGNVTSLVVNIADVIYSWGLFLAILALGFFIFIIFMFTNSNKKKTEIKSIK